MKKKAKPPTEKIAARRAMNPGSSAGGQKSQPALVDAKPSGHKLSIVHMCLNQGVYTLRVMRRLTRDKDQQSLHYEDGKTKQDDGRYPHAGPVLFFRHMLPLAHEPASSKISFGHRKNRCHACSHNVRYVTMGPKSEKLFYPVRHEHLQGSDAIWQCAVDDL